MIRDHPRMCGEHFLVEIVCGWIAGSSPHVRGARRRCVRQSWSPRIIPACAGSTSCSWSNHGRLRDHPRMCGEHPWDASYRDIVRGSSPHVRGARGRRLCRRLPYGIIPACAGSTTRPSPMTARLRDHPRMCGEHEHGGAMSLLRPGSSPHVRGAPRRGVAG